ncbi:hypothetical protein NFI96_010063 [Prochilodus magdalenae]|nr:hypothetical protein NFI96_010063 [Prochilodus magdalenae]
MYSWYTRDTSAYQPGVGVDDAVIYLLHRALSHLEKPGSTVRITFFDFSSAFNTIQPGLLNDKLEHVGVESHLSNWIQDYLTNRPQYVRARDCVSDKVVSSTGAPQGTVLAPFFFTLYTADFMYSSPNCHLQKFSDDSAIVGLITNEEDSEYRELIQDFVDWCLQNHLQINAGKTKELVVDFRRERCLTAVCGAEHGQDKQSHFFQIWESCLRNHLEPEGGRFGSCKLLFQGHICLELEEAAGLPQHKLVTETPTRWGSRQRMIQRLLEQEKAITQVLTVDRSTRHVVLTWQDIEVLDSVNKALGPLLEFTDALSAEDYVTVSCLEPVLQLFNSDILQVKENDTDLTKTIKNSILEYLNSMYEDPEVEELISLATMVDPRFHTQYMGPEEIQIMKARAVQEMQFDLPEISTEASYSEHACVLDKESETVMLVHGKPH